ncbi:MAG: DNA-directed RNA polymerase subunit beta [Krumholzibacteria bacterium]|nr:DNA-directed RNA polymerase subunit beta [Candidatus Krumholzibacteria bacterium]
MAYLDYRNRIKRVDFSKNEKVQEIPNLIQVQQESYAEFLQTAVPHEKRRDIGLQAVFKGIFPISDYNGRASLEFISYAIGDLKWSEEECRERGVTFAAPIKVTVQLVIFDVDEKTGARTIRDVKEQEVFFGEIPLMSERATFIINGTERVIVSQLHRSPGVFFEHDKGRSHASGKVLFSARIIPYRGSWLDFEFDHKDALYIKIDRKRKFPIAVLLRAFGRSTEDLLRIFYDAEEVTLQGEKYTKDFRPDLMVGLKMPVEVRHPGKAGEIAFKKGVKISKKRVERYAREGVAFGRILLPSEDLVGKVVVSDIADPATGEVLVECGQQVTAEILATLLEKKVEKLSIFTLENSDRAVWEGLVSDKIRTRDEALKEIYKKMRPGDPPTKDAAKTLFENMFFNPERYSLSRVGRLKLDHKLGITDSDLEKTVLSQEDILRVIRYLIGLKNGVGEADDIDNLGNRRVRTVGELIENQFRMGLVRVERAIREKMGLQDIETLMPHDIINAKPVSAVIKEFFGSSQLSQFMDQTNPLSEVTHKRRVSALGPGGLTRERAGFEVRDVHPTHYGRVCPIETPEGPNIGLINSLATFARVNKYGFIETPYRKVEKGTLTDEVLYLSAMEEGKFTIAQANAEVDDKGHFTTDLVSCRQGGDYLMVRPEDIDYIDVSPKQLVSVAAALIPFLENDDANRALMGCNMQRQAVPLLRADSPVVGTGMEKKIAIDSGAVITAAADGVVETATADTIVIRYDDPDAVAASSFFDQGGLVEYRLRKFKRSNQDTCYNQKPLVLPGERVTAGQPIADGPCTDAGELALGKNLLVAFMPWGGYNFEDAILVSERLVKEDVYTSLHIEEFELQVRDTKRGVEEVTREIPNVGEDALKNLDEDGVVYPGARVRAGDIMVGKVTPKGETELSPEEKLLRAIFGEKAGDVKDASLKSPPGMDGIVVGVRVFSRQDRTTRSKKEEKRQLDALKRRRDRNVAKVNDLAQERLTELFNGQTAHHIIDANTGEVLVKSGRKFTKAVLAELDFGTIHWGLPLVQEEAQDARIRSVFEAAARERERLDVEYEKNCERTLRGDELPPGVVKLVKVYVARRRKLSVGDKMAGRHGNKGVVSKIMADEDMPYLADGTPVDIVLNPLGVPSRMNLGQILETHLGYAAAAMGAKVMTPVFDGATIDEIKEALTEQGYDPSGKSALYDGRTGEAFDKPVTVGVIYMLKLHHLVEEKIHARSIGPYSLVTQQPLGGKAQFGGQRFGEMEVWALEAYGAANCLQEMLTVKSDDVTGRSRIYEAIVKGENPPEPGIPESFNVLMRELQSLCLDVTLEDAV